MGVSRLLALSGESWSNPGPSLPKLGHFRNVVRLRCLWGSLLRGQRTTITGTRWWASLLRGQGTARASKCDRFGNVVHIYVK